MDDKVAAHVGGLRLRSFLPYRLSVLAGRLSRRLAREYSQRFDLTIPQWRVLAVLGESPGLYADDICRMTEMDKVTVSRAARSLLAQSRIRRTRDTKDGRRSVIHLTPEGRSVYRRAVPLALALEREMLQDFSPRERADLNRLLTQLTARAAADSLPAPADPAMPIRPGKSPADSR